MRQSAISGPTSREEGGGGVGEEGVMGEGRKAGWPSAVLLLIAWLTGAGGEEAERGAFGSAPGLAGPASPPPFLLRLLVRPPLGPARPSPRPCPALLCTEMHSLHSVGCWPTARPTGLLFSFLLLQSALGPLGRRRRRPDDRHRLTLLGAGCLGAGWRA